MPEIAKDDKAVNGSKENITKVPSSQFSKSFFRLKTGINYHPTATDSKPHFVPGVNLPRPPRKKDKLHTPALVRTHSS